MRMIDGKPEYKNGLVSGFVDLCVYVWKRETEIMYACARDPDVVPDSGQCGVNKGRESHFVYTRVLCVCRTCW